MPKNINEKWYHFAITKFDENNIETGKKYYKSLYEMTEEYKVSRATISNLITGRVKRSRKLGNVIIKRIREPVRISIMNPEFTS